MSKTHSKIKYFDLYGLRKEKGEFLESHDVKNTKWRELEPKEPNFWFVPKDMRGEKSYDKFISVKDIFNYFQAGITTGQDKLFVDMNYHSLKARMLQIFNRFTGNEELKLLFKLDSQAGEKLLENRDKADFKEALLKSYSYRVFDTRHFYSENKFLWRSVEKLQQQFSKENVAMITTKSLSTNLFRHIFITKNAGDYSFISDKTREVNYYFPLYLYNTDIYAPKSKKSKSSYGNLMLFGKPKEKEPNIKAEIIDMLSESYKKKIAPEEIFYYIYAVLYSNAYRKKYNEFLKIDFPKIPFAKDVKIFNKISKLGGNLADLHLLKSKKLENDKGVKFPAVGNNKVEKREFQDINVGAYSPETGKKPKLKSKGIIKINDKQFFTGVSKEVWDYHIGGYQVLDKWLKDRKDKILSREEVDHYLKVISALKLTIEAQKEIDELYGKVEKNLISCKE